METQNITIFEQQYFDSDGCLNVPSYEFFRAAMAKLKENKDNKEAFEILFKQIDNYIPLIDHSDVRLDCFRELKTYLRSIDSKYSDMIDETVSMTEDDESEVEVLEDGE